MTMFAILEESSRYRLWVRLEGTNRSFTTARYPGPPEDLQYPDRATAERDAETFRAQNARAVERTKRKRKHKIDPATYSVLPVEPEGGGA